jgi:signal transduction histidine kinase
MNQQSILALKNNNLLKNTDINCLNIGKQIGKLKAINGGEILYRSGDSANSVYLILNGEVNLIKKSLDGKSQSVVFSENDFFGAKELFSNIERCTTTVSLMDTYLVELSKEEVNYLVESDDKIALNIQKGNADFKFDEGSIEFIKKECFYDSDYEDEEEMLDDFISENDISDIISSIEQQEKDILDNFEDFGTPEINLDNQNSKEIIDNDEKNKYNWEVKDFSNIHESIMINENNQSEKKIMSSEQFELIIKSLQLVNANVKQDDVLTNVIDVAVNLTNADRGTLYLVEKGTNEIWSKVLVGGEVEEIRLKIGDGIAGWVAENGQTLNINDVTKDERFDGSFDKATGYSTKNMLVYPIKNKTEETIAVVQLLNSLKGGFSEQDEKFLNIISLNLAIALENSSLVLQLINSERNISIGKMGNFLTYDLKKPILTCKRYAEHLKKKDLAFDVKQVVNLLDEQLDQVSSQITSASGFTEGTTLLRRQPVSLNDILYDFAFRTQGLTKSFNCKVEHELTSDVNINVDKREFYQCFYNIIKNSCEALPEGGIIIISTKIKDNNIEIVFNDRGIGIDSHDIEKVFDPLYTKNKKNNSGLGLSISQKIVEDHGGAIRITSEKENGTNVIISLPIH